MNGTYACENDPLLDRDLKSSMGFAGFVMSDWKAAHSTEAVQHGLDMEMPTGQYFVDYKLKALPPGGGAAGRPDPREATQDAALRVLTSMYRLRLDERPGCEPPCLRERAADVRTEAHVALARKAATRSVVVLKNEVLRLLLLSSSLLILIIIILLLIVVLLLHMLLLPLLC